MKTQRQQAILHLVRTTDVFTQEELTQSLINAGFSVTQATVSRDIRELRLVKEQTLHGQKYVAPPLPQKETTPMERLFRDAVTGIDCAGNMMVIHTHIGMAMAVAVALDNMKLPEILGSVAGDDVIISVIRTPEQAKNLMETLQP